MKLVDLYIYGYGQLENVEIKNLTDFQVFFGENEAGKSTIMAFIHSILFGFPTKQQSSELRYEPKNNAKYGGKIRIYHEKYGYAVIERVKGKAAGDVAVLLENGAVGGEELLKDLLLNFDKSLFQAIFSFNLQGVQNIHQMKGDEIGRFLFSAGTLGTERLAQTEAALQKELDARFKPGGKKPLLNEQLQALRDLNGELKKASSKNQEYELLIENREVLQQEMMKTTESLHRLKEETEKLKEWQKIKLFVQEEKSIHSELEKLGGFKFPARGIEQLEMLNQSIRPLLVQQSSLETRIENLKIDIGTVQPNTALLDCESEIIIKLDQIPQYDQLKFEKQQCEMKLKELVEDLSTIREKLHSPLQEEEILSINTNIYMKDQVEKIARKSQKLIEKRQELENRFQEEKKTLEVIEGELQFLEEQVLSEKERAKLEEQINDGNDKKSLEMEWNGLKDKIEFFKRSNQRDVVFQKQRKQQFFVFEIILLGLSIYGLVTQQWLLLLLGVLGMILVAVFLSPGLKQTKETNVNQSLEQLNEKEKQLFQKLQSVEFRNIGVAEEQLKLDNHRREQLQTVKIKLEQQQNQYEKVIAKSEEWEKEAALHKKALGTISNELRIPERISNSHLLEAFQLIENCKVIGREKKQLQDRIDQIGHELEKTVEGIEFYSNQFVQERNIDLYKSVYLLRAMIKEEHEKKIKSSEKQAKLGDLESDQQQIKRELEQLQLERNDLLTEANVENEQQFYELGINAEQRAQYIGRLGDIEKQLQHSSLIKSEREYFLQLDHVEELIKDCNNQVQEMQSQLKMDQEELASLNYEIQVIEEGGVYSAILHQFKQKKYEVEEAGKEWAVYAIAQDILSKTIEKYKNVHLPRMLSKAEAYLSFLTEGNYKKIHLQKSGTGFLIERTDHTVFEANELSQATTEQVYVSIRLALATTLYESYHFPIIIDDSFVNFDEKRTEKVIELLTSLKQNQILFFTCHPHMLKYFQKGSILRLEKGAVQNIS